MKRKKINKAKLLKAGFPYLFMGLMATKLGQAYRMASGGDVLDRIFGAFLTLIGTDRLPFCAYLL